MGKRRSTKEGDEIDGEWRSRSRPRGDQSRASISGMTLRNESIRRSITTGTAFLAPLSAGPIDIPYRRDNNLLPRASFPDVSTCLEEDAREEYAVPPPIAPSRGRRNRNRVPRSGTPGVDLGRRPRLGRPSRIVASIILARQRRASSLGVNSKLVASRRARNVSRSFGERQAWHVTAKCKNNVSSR